MGRIARMIVVSIVAGVLLGAGLGGCGDLVAPHQRESQSEAAPSQPTGVDEDRFKNAWEKLKDIFVATSVATALSEFRKSVGELGEELDKIDLAALNEDEKRFRSRFYAVHQALNDSALLWTADVESSVTGCEGIPLYDGDDPLLPQADEIVARYSLEVKNAPGSSVRCVPDDSVSSLWDLAFTQAQEWLLPVLH